MSTDPYIGSLSTFAGTFTVENWAMCLGQLQAIAQNTALFSLVGSLYGGDSRTTFGVPDLRGRSPVGQGTMVGGLTYPQGLMMGKERVTLKVSQLPAHSHTATFTPTGGGTSVTGKLEVATNDGTTKVPSNSTYLAAGTASENYITPGLGGVNLTEIQGLTVTGGGDVSGVVTIGSTGSDQPVDIINPVLPMNWLIALQGIYPPRS
ncbi:tail fiber protein [Pseudoalteromonas sp. OOF1S-7]|uniref:phage tail protein n=1 Tax=Pseudoalteromonas sp. OOF1S-7 TaxID=2917757 RepID=UPI001EF58A4E|nr:tail fiber protein [Pseudoalteromonas sp. OOF1S-7]MCG7534314.1 tail fiber protein [Pseudoalteromonas sp. OOF1S-7]